MRNRLITAPWWVLSIWQSVFLVVFVFGFVALLFPDRSFEQMLSTMLGFLIWGAADGRMIADRNRRTIEATGLTDYHDIDRALTASRRGPIPQDVRLRRAAHGLAARRLARLRKVRAWLSVAAIGSTVFYVAMAVLVSPRWWVATLVLMILIGLKFRQFWTMAIRTRELADEQH